MGLEACLGGLVWFRWFCGVGLVFGGVGVVA